MLSLAWRTSRTGTSLHLRLTQIGRVEWRAEKQEGGWTGHFDSAYSRRLQPETPSKPLLDFAHLVALAS